MKDTIKFKIITPEKVVYEDEASEISLPTKAGEITILANHTPLVTLIKTGEIRVKKKDVLAPIPLTVSSGVIEIRESSSKNGGFTEVIILANRAELASDIDIDRAKIAHEKALRMAEEKKHEADIDFARFESLIDKESNRIKVYTKWNK